MGRSATHRQSKAMGAAAVAVAGTIGSTFHSLRDASSQAPRLGFLVPGDAQRGAAPKADLSSSVAAPAQGSPAAACGSSWSTAASGFGTALVAAAVAPQLRRRAKLARRAAKEAPELKSERDVDYTELKNLLESKDFKAADAETRRLLIVLAGEQAVKRGWVYFAEVKTIPEVDFQTIDSLWGFHSSGKFGFTPQRKVWRKVRAQFDKFAEEVSWFTDKWQNRNWPDEFIYDDKKAPAGHLPLTNCIRGAQVLEELLNHPMFAKEKATTAKKKGGMSLLALGGSRERQSGPMTFAGASRAGVAGPRAVALRAVAETSAATGTAAPASLSSLEQNEVINEFGFVFPEVPDDTAASAFLILCSQGKPQYLGFSKDLRNTLRTLLCRRPELCYQYKCVNFPQAGKEQLLELRADWIKQLGELPVGNRDPRQKALWESPVDGGGMSARAYRTAADQKAKQVLRQLKDRGLKELVEFDDQLMEEGKVEALPSVVDKSDLSQQQEAMSSRTTRVEQQLNGKDISMEIFYAAEFATNGGYWLDVEVSAAKQKSSHRVIVGNDFIEQVGAESPREVVEKAFLVLIANKVARRTEGIITSEDFPINYFTAANVATWFPEFVELFKKSSDEFDWHTNQWNFKQVHDYSQDDKRTIPAGPMGGLFDPAALQ